MTKESGVIGFKLFQFLGFGLEVVVGIQVGVPAPESHIQASTTVARAQFSIKKFLILGRDEPMPAARAGKRPA